MNNLIQTYNQYPIELQGGKGSFIFDKNSKKYLDFYGGHAVCLLGHCPKTVVEAIKKQSKKLIFYSNIFSTQPAIKLANKLSSTLNYNYQVYFTNSGSEANETAIKIARKHTSKKQIISFKNSFHGRSISALAATGIKSYHQFNPNLNSYTKFATLGNMKSIKKLYNKNTAAVICEPIQSIGGINMSDSKFYQKLSKFCQQKNILLIFDEVQTGLGRTGKFWFSNTLNIKPDMITTAKGIASGLPLSAVMVKNNIANKIKKGEHATTFGGGPLVCAAGLATINQILKKGFLNQVRKKSGYIRKELKKIEAVQNIKGKGLLLGIELKKETPNLIKNCLEQGLIIGGSMQKNIYRIMPPLNCTYQEINLFIKIFKKITT